MTYTTEYNAQLAAILTAVKSVTDVGRVHDRPRLGDFRERWVTDIGGQTQIRSWEIAPGAVQVVRREQAYRHRTRPWIIRGVVGLEDMAAETTNDPTGEEDTAASWHVIQRLAGEIADAIDATRETSTAAGTVIEQEPTQIGEPQQIVIGGGALCWGITLTVVGKTIVTP